MKRDRLGRFLSPRAAARRAGGGGRSRGRPGRGGGPSVDEAAALAATRRGWGAARACGDAGEDGAGEPGPGRPPAMGRCRLCHGRFSARSLRCISGRAPGPGAEKPAAGERAFARDFQGLLGVAVLQDPALPPFVCRGCHAQFYQCHGLLSAFLQRVNAPPPGPRRPCARAGAHPLPGSDEGACPADLTGPGAQGLCRLVGWVHGHAARCGALPRLQRALASEFRGVVRAVWGCDRGHDYTMDAEAGGGAPRRDGGPAAPWAWGQEAPRRPQPRGPGAAAAEPETQPSPEPAQPLSEGDPGGPGPGPPPQPSQPPGGAAGRSGEKQVPSAASDDRVKDEFSDLSEGDLPGEDDSDRKPQPPSSDESFEPGPEKRASAERSEGRDAKKPAEPKVRRKPGPKPGWKSKLRGEREELPTIYKCPHQGCTAVYRGADGMKKHVKEHHEEVRERPCPHPGCNKVFMIDRYLQRHVKLIHTEVRNYICDECGQTFKQRKHLLVHQMRHSGAKPLQCEVCGFQCRQRASLKYHMTKHTAEAELAFACEQCGRRFEKAHNLNVHMSMVHPLTQARAPPTMAAEGRLKPEPT